MTHKSPSPQLVSFPLTCSSKQEADDIAKLISKYRHAMNVCFREELGHDCTMTDGTIVKECLIDGLRVTRKAISIIKSTGTDRG